MGGHLTPMCDEGLLIKVGYRLHRAAEHKARVAWSGLSNLDSLGPSIEMDH